MSSGGKSAYTRMTALLVAIFIVVAAAAAVIGLCFGGDSGGNESEFVSSMVPGGESLPPVVSVEQPQPGELIPEDYRAIWLSEADIASYTSSDEVVSPAKDTGFTAVIADVFPGVNTDTLSELSEFTLGKDMAFQLNFTYVPADTSDVIEILESVSTVAAVFFPGDADKDILEELKELISETDGRTAFGIVSGTEPEESVSHIADCVCVCPENDSAPAVMEAWGSALAGSNIPLILGVSVDPEKAESDPRYMVELQNIANATANYRGTAVRNVENMYTDTTGAVTALISLLNGENKDYVGGELSIVEPVETTYIAYGKVFTLRGSGNPIYELKVNSEPVPITDSGIFTWSCELEAGENIITVSHMGKTVVFTVERRIDVLNRVSPQDKTYADGGVAISLTARALSGAEVTASFNGEKIVLSEQEDPENENASGEYVLFSALYTLPEGTEEEQDLGRITFRGTMDGYTETVIGGRVYVNPLPEPEPDRDIVEIATIKVNHSDGEDFTKTYPTMYLDDNSAPIQYFLATGMKDTVVREASFTGEDGLIEYYVLSGGVMVHKSDCTVETTEEIINNISSAALSEEGGYTVLRFSGTDPVAVIPSLLPVDFTGKHPLGYSVDSFEVRTVELLFTNTVAVSDIMGFANNKLFSGYEWERVSDGQYKLVLTLKKTGGFYGIKTEVDSKGRVVISFKNPVSLEKADNEYGYSLEGITVVLDAGHNGNYPYNPGAAGFYEGLHEANLNLILAEKTKEKLEALGAEVVMTRTNNASDMTRSERVAKILESGADVCIAIHHNGATSSSAYGTSAYYFYPFAKDFSECVYERMVEMYQENIYTSGSKKDGCAKGCGYYPYYMTRIQEFPCILVETGYITNLEEYEYLIRDDIQELVAEAFTQGIVDYLASQSN